MSRLRLSLGLLAGAAALGMLGVAQLIWAGSEASYYAHLMLAVVLLSGLLLLARTASTRVLSIAITAFALVVSLMPIESRFLALSLSVRPKAAQPREGELIGGGSSLTDLLMGTAGLWLLYIVLLSAFALGMRDWFARTKPRPE